MKKLLSYSFILFFFIWMISCVSYRDNPKVDFDHGPRLEDRYISIVNSTPDEIEFRIRMGDRADYLYHVVLDEEEDRISEGWIWTRYEDTEHYTFKMKPKKGSSFQPGKRYRLCIGFNSKHPDYYPTDNYRCQVDYEFTLSEK